MFIIGSCMVEVKNGAAQLPDAFNLRSQELSWHFAGSNRSSVYMKPENYIDKATLKEMRHKQRKVLVDKKNIMYFPQDILNKMESSYIRINGLAGIIEAELISECEAAAAV